MSALFSYGDIIDRFGILNNLTKVVSDRELLMINVLPSSRGSRYQLCDERLSLG